MEKRCPYELCVEKYFGLTQDTPSGYIIRGVTFNVAVDLLCAFDQQRERELDLTDYEDTVWYNPKTMEIAKTLTEITGLNDNDGCYIISTKPIYKTNS